MGREKKWFFSSAKRKSHRGILPNPLHNDTIQTKINACVKQKKSVLYSWKV